ncbi:DUF4364 family protein [Anaerosalibacter bizertensis]|uniref:DUF4364 family protein n=1 Tax=Anaerosalibacter bizertensis TaxID=932217 RepID=A0A844FIH8_9FIRM|nr:DUF4364 family protein [Anaerosalibacter bizertensis]MBV1819029.1 DUF4364 family protein [Bacteroidales bacterium MSK.15.36]HHV25630.1 DUF4364 family protein [Tissierellia bacterium]MBU5294192.1 DUF4364 family protein [Anaerosalibacter bizertensis]MCB5560003.1 DUF4364 family protein [Anaerosalibacter bizertensis]MCG4565746.1 DUF4364 family protein [Anaerosalibacter bizertensis]
MFIDSTEELAQNKLLLLYIIDKSEIPLTNGQITEFVLENNYMNYFLVQQFLSELTRSKFIEYSRKEEKERYTILKKGKLTLNYFIHKIPDEIKNDIDKKFEVKKEELKRETQIIGDYFKKNKNEYVVNLKLVEKDSTLFSLYLNVVSSEQAKMICNNWKSNPDKIYQEILNTLIK